MKRKTCLSILLTLVMIFSLVLGIGGQAFAVDAAAKPSDQIKLIASKFADLKQKDAKDAVWCYTVADLDHNGQLELIAAAQSSTDFSTSFKVWTVSKDAKEIAECTVDKAGGASLPDLLTDTIDTYHDTKTDTWYYMVTDTVMVSATNMNTSQVALKLKDGVISYEPYAMESTFIENGYRTVRHVDKNGIGISAEQYNAAGANAFAEAERSNTALEWLTAKEAAKADRLTESYEVFDGTREPTEVFPVPKSGTEPTPAIIPVQPDQGSWLYVTKNPTNENRVTGDTAIFIALASNYESLEWTFVSPGGGEYSPANFLAGSGATINGANTTTISVVGLESWMNNWGVFCTFHYRGQTARTTTAYMFVSNRPAPTPQPQPSYGSVSGTAYRSGGNYNIRLQGGATVSVSSGICKVEGQFYDGCSAVVYYTDSPVASNIYRVDIFGNMGLIVPDGATSQHATGLIVPDGALGGWAGSQYYNNEPTYADDSLGGGYAGSNYTDYTSDPNYNAKGDEYNRVTCPNCGNHFSMGLPACPVCGFSG